MEKDEKKKTSSTSSVKKTSKKSKTNPTDEKMKKDVLKKETKKGEKEIKEKVDLTKEEEKVTTSDLGEYDEDLEDMEEVEIQEKPKKAKTEKKEEKKEKELRANVEKIEKIAQDKKKKVNTSKNNNSKLNEFATFFEKHHIAIYSFVAGVFITTLIAFIIWPDRIATLKDGTQPVVKINKKTYTANDLYEDMKSYYSVSLLLDKIDNDLLTKMYPEDDTMTSEVKSNAEYYFNTYKQYYNYTQEQFLEKNGFSSYDAFLDYLRLDYRRNKYLEDYIKKNLSEDEIKKYYDENVFGDINTQHILVEVKSDSDKEDSKKLSDEDAKKLAEEIITKLNDGTSWEQIQKDYKDKITYEDLSYQSWDASLEESFMTALKKMDNNSYSEEPVKTSYGYHVIHRLDQKKKPTLKKSRDKIISNLVSDKKSADSNLLYKSLISLRKEKKIDFSDTVMKSKYESYCNQYK